MSPAPAQAGSERLIHVIQGEYAVARDDDAVMTSVLGSCVAACLRDPQAGIGGMNHFLLPEMCKNASDNIIYGAQAMELLINGLLRLGAQKDRIEAKLFGGGQMIKGLSGIGRRNAEFARQFLRDEGIRCVADSLGGTKARRVRFWPQSGRVRLLLLNSASVEVAAPRAPKPPVSDDFELF